MKLRYSPTSPYVRKVNATAIETGLRDRLEWIPTNAWDPADDLPTVNPLGKVPALITDEGEVLYDSVVICEYLDSVHGGARLFPPEGPARWRALKLHALADGMLDASVLRLVEHSRRPKELFWPEWDDRQKGKVDRALDALEAHVDLLEGSPDIGKIAVGCALGYLDFRFPAEDWRGSRPRLAAWYETFAQRPSMRETEPYQPA